MSPGPCPLKSWRRTEHQFPVNVAISSEGLESSVVVDVVMFSPLNRSLITIVMRTVSRRPPFTVNLQQPRRLLKRPRVVASHRRGQNLPSSSRREGNPPVSNQIRGNPSTTPLQFHRKQTKSQWSLQVCRTHSPSHNDTPKL